MYKLFDMICTTPECPLNQVVIEMLVNRECVTDKCQNCGDILRPLSNCAMGKVKNGTPQFHYYSRNKNK